MIFDITISSNVTEIIIHIISSILQLHLNAMPVNGHAVRTNLITLIVSQAIIGVIKKSIVMTSQMNKIAVSTNSINFLWYS